MCCCTDFEGYYEVADFYQSHPRYYYSDYNSCGCRKCQCCYENHCSCCNCYYSCNEKLCQCCYERHNYRYFNFLRILFSISSLVTFPIVSFISVLHLCNPTLRDKDFEENYKDQDIKYKTPMTISKFYSKFKLKGKTYSNSKSEIDNFDSSDESNEIQDVEKPFANQQAPVEEENSYSGSENSAIELPPIQEKTEIKTSQPETKQEQPKVKINPDIVPSITEKNEENHDVNKVEETALKPLQLSGSRQLSYACSPLAANETENSVFVQSIQEPPLEEPSNVAKIGLDILPLPAQHALPPPNFENNYQSDETHEKHDESHGERSRNSKMKRQHRMSMPNFSNIPEFTPLNNEAVDHFKDILDHRNVLTDDDANDIFFPKKRGHQKRKYSHDVWRKSMELFEPPSNFDTETIEIPENIPSNETISNYSSRNNSEEEIPNFVGTLPLFQADGMSIIIPPTAAEYNGIAPPITFIDPQGNVKPTEKRRQKKRRASAWVEKPTISKTNDLSFLF
ncbi:hypothetical protein TVAG_461160 [Trichomonas vaginalis G3]|uniref:Uncharacterized protein n=1 Tax=Trichomonas vaginalis (strain ATCC PRA-98 / G3) TaxID=412133 RepID=A2G9Y6_TRIV3|nr:hypothetical protein TVAGG3_0196800 [Trichomonas vaginalis G3]EAX86032.1 hypothetical protein TVAG_461160 [Trichomonas vaginalis G3]KAI5550356.1 hypothetical protein TVAGG3_0196800 [Trichomonas vaginalis G3]|eukprot:XP_001298962.1 hypothetical protein [Trichomonas vaginalis G3]